MTPPRSLLFFHPARMSCDRFPRECRALRNPRPPRGERVASIEDASRVRGGSCRRLCPSPASRLGRSAPSPRCAGRGLRSARRDRCRNGAGPHIRVSNSRTSSPPGFARARGWARLLPSPRNEGSDAPRRRVVRITPDGPDDHSGRTRIAGSWRISGCAAPTRRATRHLRLYAFNGSVGPARSLSATGGLPTAARGRDVCGVTLAGAASRLTSRHLMRVPLS